MRRISPDPRLVSLVFALSAVTLILTLVAVPAPANEDTATVSADATSSTEATTVDTSPSTPPALPATRSATMVTASSETTVPDPSAPASAPATPNGRLVVIDPGHGGRYSNANANGLREKNVNLWIALELRDLLQNRGYTVVMTRETDRAVNLYDIPTWNYRSATDSWVWARDGVANGSLPKDDLQARAHLANSLGADLFISVHANGAARRTARGYETFASRRDALGVNLSRTVQRSVIEKTGFVDRGAKTADFYVLRWTNVPAILIEAGFITNPSDAALLKRPAFRTRIVEGVADGVDRWMATNPYRRIYTRVGGSNTSSFVASLTAAQFPNGAPVAVLASADSWSDVPGAASLAVSLGGPLLWTGANGVDASVSAALSSLAPERVVLVAKNGSVSVRAVTRIASAAGIKTKAVDTIGGVGAASISASLAESVGVGPAGHVFVASVSDTTTLLTAASVAASRRAPLLVARNGRLSTGSLAFIAANRASIRRIVLVGAASQVPTTVADGLPWRRYFSADAAALAASLNSAYHTERRANRLRPVVADPYSAPEYLSSSVRAAGMKAPVLPINGRVLPAKTREWITNRRSAIAGFEIHDATGAAPTLIDHQLRKSDYL
jgi:N-acetylmuramoyl-L-alanine amidase